MGKSGFQRVRREWSYFGGAGEGLVFFVGGCEFCCVDVVLPGGDFGTL